jgi:hypothetical protein
MVLHYFKYPWLLLVFKMFAFSFDTHSCLFHSGTRSATKCLCHWCVWPHQQWDTCIRLANITKIFQVSPHMEVKRVEVWWSLANSADFHGQSRDRKSADSYRVSLQCGGTVTFQSTRHFPLPTAVQPLRIIPALINAFHSEWPQK